MKVAVFRTPTYGEVTVRFDPTTRDGEAVFDRFPGTPVPVVGGVFLSPNGVNRFEVRFPAVAGTRGARLAKSAALDVMMPNAFAEAADLPE